MEWKSRDIQITGSSINRSYNQHHLEFQAFTNVLFRKSINLFSFVPERHSAKNKSSSRLRNESAADKTPAAGKKASGS